MLREQLDQVGTVNKGLTESLWKAREDAESCDTRLRREQEVRKTSGMRCLRQKGNGVHPFLYRDCAIKLLLSSHGVGIPFIASFVNSFSFPVHFTAMIFELLFPVKTFQLLRGRKILCKQSGVRAVNGLHLLIQRNPIICMFASVSPGVLLLHLLGITIKLKVAISSPHHLNARFYSGLLLVSADVCLPVESGTGSCQSAVAPGRLPAEQFHPAKDVHWQVSVACCQNPSGKSEFHKTPTFSCESHNCDNNPPLSATHQSGAGQQGHWPLLIVSHCGEILLKVPALTVKIIHQDEA